MSSDQAPVKGCDKDPAAAAPKRVRSPATDALWGAAYDVAYVAKSMQTAATRKASKEKAKARRGVAPTGDELAMADVRQARLRSKEALLDLRMQRGFRWGGGAVVPGSAYHRPAFTYEGLVSDEHPILRLFVSKLRRAKHMRIGDDKSQSYISDSKLLALDAPYVEANKIVCGIVRVEIDTVVAVEEIRAACAASGAPEPNLVVGWQDAASRYHRPHLVWLLHKSVPLAPKAAAKVAPGGRKPKRFLSLFRGVMRGLVDALLPLGADPGGVLNCHRHKNPVSPLWQRAILAEQPYDLAELAEQVDTRVRMKQLHERAAEMRGDTQLAADHPEPAVAARSNKLFADLATWARLQVMQVRAAGGEEAEFASLVAQEACRAAAAVAGDGARSETIALATATRVADWTWNVYQAPEPRVKLSAEQVVGRRAEGGRIAARHRRAKTEDILLAAAIRLRELGLPVTQAAVLARVQAEGVKGERTIRRHWSMVLDALAEADRSDAPPSVKKGASIGMLERKNTEGTPHALRLSPLLRQPTSSCSLPSSSAPAPVQRLPLSLRP